MVKNVKNSKNMREIWYIYILYADDFLCYLLVVFICNHVNNA